MSLSIYPLSKTAYTDNGNKYQKSYLGTTVGITSVAVNAAFDKIEHVAKVANGVKLSNIKPSNILQNTKNHLAKVFQGLEKMTVKAQVALSKPKAEKTLTKAPIFKRALKGSKNFGTKTIETVRAIKVPSLTKDAKLVTIIAAGVAFDYAINKIRAKNADKDVMLK